MAFTGLEKSDGDSQNARPHHHRPKADLHPLQSPMTSGGRPSGSPRIEIRAKPGQRRGPAEFPQITKPWEGLGGGVWELREDDQGGAIDRRVYVVRLGAIHVPRVFKKKSHEGAATPPSRRGTLSRALRGRLASVTLGRNIEITLTDPPPDPPQGKTARFEIREKVA